MSDIYNPFSLVKALDSREIEDHWFMTVTPTRLVRLLWGGCAHLDEMVGRYYSVEEFEDCRADVERPPADDSPERLLDGTAGEALRQISWRGYVRPYDGGAFRVHRVGVSFSSEMGAIGEWREE